MFPDSKRLDGVVGLTPGAIGMEMHFSIAEGRVLHGLLEEASGDIVVRIDPAGFIIYASQNATELGIDLKSLLLMPHISDFAVSGHGQGVADYAERVFAGNANCTQIEFPVPVCINPSHSDEHCEPTSCQRWYSLSLKCVEPDNGAPQGAIGLLRSVQQKHSLQREINARALSDPLTGLANRHALCASLRRAITEQAEQTMAVFAIDRLRAVFMQYGQQTADEIQWGFAQYLQSMVGPGQELAQLDTERFAVILHGVAPRQAKGWAQDVLSTFAGLTISSSARTPELSASVGLARIERTVDWTLRQAELGLVMAQAGGGMQVGMCNTNLSNIASGANVERAMEAAMARAARRRA